MAKPVPSQMESDHDTGTIVIDIVLFLNFCMAPLLLSKQIIYNEQIILKLFCVSLHCLWLMNSSSESWLGNREKEK